MVKHRYFIVGLLILAIVVGFVAYRAYADSVGPNSPTSATDDSSVGTITWANPTNAKVSDTSCATATINTAAVEKSVKIIKGGVISGTDKSTGATLASHVCGATQTSTNYGSSSDLWGLSWTTTDINASNFGLAYSAGDSTSQSHYLDVTGFGFSIPAGSTINGILASVQSSDDSVTGVCGISNCASVNYISITITYTTSSGTPQVQIRSGTLNIKSGSVIIK